MQADRRNARDPSYSCIGTLGAQSTNWGSYSLAFKRAGYCVRPHLRRVHKCKGNFPIRFGGLTNIKGSSKELRNFVKKVRKRPARQG
ncbi:MAG: hypothetical protein R2709_00810 [Marmoricola sp.]